MPIGPNGEKRPYGVVANAILSMEIATGQAKETIIDPSPLKERLAWKSTKRLSRITMLAAVAKWGPPRPAKSSSSRG